MSETIKCVAIDDEPLALDIIETFCRRIGNVELQKFSNPEAGLEAIRLNKPDIVFLDIEMDGMNGLAIASQLPETHVSYLQPPICDMQSRDLTSMRLTICTSRLPTAGFRPHSRKRCAG